jgi:glycosyltransferase involved in cell wall biosynthesis
MGPQDGVDLAVRAAAHVVHDLGREDVAFTFMGSGDSYDELAALRDELRMQDHLELPGRVPDETVLDVLSTAEVSLSPDPKNPLNDVSTMNKTMEYMAYGLPAVSFGLTETRVSGGDTLLYVPSGEIGAYADALEKLIDDPALRAELGRKARARVVNLLDWRPQAEAYVSVYDELSGFSQIGPAVPPLETSSDTDPQGRRYVDLDDDDEFTHYLLERGARAKRSAR